MNSNFQLLTKSLDLEAELTATNLNSLIAEIDLLRLDLKIAKWSFLKAWCDESVSPGDADEGELWRILERLCMVWEDRGNG